MKKIIFSLIFGINSFCAFAQVQLFITDNTKLSLDSNIFMINKQTNFTNDGSFQANEGLVRFTNESDTEIQIGGFGQSFFHDLEVDNPNARLQLETDITVDNQLIFTAGPIQLNGFTIFLGENGQLIDENESNHINAQSGGTIQKTVVINTPNAFSAGNMGFELTAAKDLGNIRVIRGHESQTINQNQNSIHRYFDFQVEQNDDLNAKLRIYYFDSELNELTESDLAIWQNDGSGWAKICYTDRSETENWVEVEGLQTLHRYTLAATPGCGVFEIPKSLFVNNPFEIVSLEDFPNNELYILNRWQQVIYHAKPYINGDWDGTYNGKPLAQGTYYIIFKSSDQAAPQKKSIYVLGRN